MALSKILIGQDLLISIQLKLAILVLNIMSPNFKYNYVINCILTISDNVLPTKNLLRQGRLKLALTGDFTY